MALAGLFVSTGLYAQTAPPATTPTGQPAPAAAAPDPARLDTLLHKWEDEMKKVQTLSAELSRSSVDKAYGKSDTYSGSAKYMKPNLAALEMVRKDDPQRYEKYVCTGTFLYEFVPASKVLRVHDLPSSKSGVSDDNFLSFLFGMKAEEAKKRYEMRLVKEDQWYVYIEVMPRFPADKADFQKARLILNHSNFLPRQVWFEQPNGNEITWDIPKLLSGPDAKVQRSDFDQPKQPAGWTTVRAPKTAAPSNDPAQPTNKVVRPQQPQP
jgi:TIGR03009 family protein